jgi:cytochrome c556
MKAVAIAVLCSSAFVAAIPVGADEDPRKQRQELMKEVREAAKPLGEMLRGTADVNAATVAESLAVFERAAANFGSLFPEGTETGMDTEAAPAIWTDREGFEEILDKFGTTTAAAQGMPVTNLDQARAALGPVFQNCKNCHDSYRIEEE